MHLGLFLKTWLMDDSQLGSTHPQQLEAWTGSERRDGWRNCAAVTMASKQRSGQATAQMPQSLVCTTQLWGFRILPAVSAAHAGDPPFSLLWPS